MIWSHEEIWQQTTLFMDRAFAEDRNGPLFPLWAILGLELLARAALARVHPALLADPQSGENLLYSFGFAQPERPRSIPVKTVFLRCMHVVPEFLKSDFELSMGLIELRNAELHAGPPAFLDLPTRLWLSDFFRICEKLLTAQGAALEDLFGAEEASAAGEMITASDAAITARTNEKVERASRTFALLPVGEKTQRRERAERDAHIRRELYKKATRCPACESVGTLSGKLIREREPVLRENVIYQEDIVLPTSFECSACGLTLETHGEVHAAGLGGQFMIEREIDPVGYLSIDIADYLGGDDYGND